MSDKRKYPRTQALAVAKEIMSPLADVTLRIAVAGSLRRGKPEVGDVEIVYVPLTDTVPVDLFGGTVARDLAAARIEQLVISNLLAKRLNHDGHPTWGPKNKLAVHVASGIPVDLFATTEECWWNYLVCRTGSAETNKQICIAAQERGWKWNPYGPGFSRGCETESVTSEAEVFAFVGLPYMPPEKR